MSSLKQLLELQVGMRSDLNVFGFKTWKVVTWGEKMVTFEPDIPEDATLTPYDHYGIIFIERRDGVNSFLIRALSPGIEASRADYIPPHSRYNSIQVDGELQHDMEFHAALRHILTKDIDSRFNRLHMLEELRESIIVQPEPEAANAGS